MATTGDIQAWLNSTYPERNWDQDCQRLMWNVIYFLRGYTRDSQMTRYATAQLAREASRIESRDASKAPAGAMHWWRNPVGQGHVAVELGGGQVMMTGTPAALGKGGYQLATGDVKNYGVTTVAAYSEARGNEYLGWSRLNGANESIIGLINNAAPGSENGEEEMNFVWIKGKANGWRGGLYAVVNGKGVFLGAGSKPSGVVELTDETHIKALQAAIPGLK